MAPAPESAPTLTINSFEAIVALAAEKRDISMKTALERDVRLVRCEDGKLELALEKTAPRTLINDLSRKLTQWTGKRWMVIVSAEQGAPTMKVQTEARDADLKLGAQGDPLVQAVLARFPGAIVEKVTPANAAEVSPDSDVPDNSEND
jgi:DNA polymerase-3 subunit gamma/tau